LRPWDQARPKPVDARVTHILGEDYLLPLDVELSYRVSEEAFVITSSHEVTVTFGVDICLLLPDGRAIIFKHKLSCLFFSSKPLEDICSGRKFGELLAPQLTKLRGNGHRPNRFGLEGCLDVMIRKRRIAEGKLARALPKQMRICP
jgi:hypothetical protein